VYYCSAETGTTSVRGAGATQPPGRAHDGLWRDAIDFTRKLGRTRVGQSANGEQQNGMADATTIITILLRYICGHCIMRYCGRR